MLIEVVGIAPQKQKASVTIAGKTISLAVDPNTGYRYNGNFQVENKIEFSNPVK